MNEVVQDRERRLLRMLHWMRQQRPGISWSADDLYLFDKWFSELDRRRKGPKALRTAIAKAVLSDVEVAKARREAPHREASSVERAGAPAEDAWDACPAQEAPSRDVDQRTRTVKRTPTDQELRTRAEDRAKARARLLMEPERCTICGREFKLTPDEWEEHRVDCESQAEAEASRVRGPAMPEPIASGSSPYLQGMWAVGDWDLRNEGH